MKVIDVYKQYFKGNCIYNEIQRNGVLVVLTATSDSGTIKYEVGLTFFPHLDDEDYGISYDAYLSKEIYFNKGRRSKKKEEVFLKDIKKHADELANQLNGVIHWEEPLIEAIFG